HAMTPAAVLALLRTIGGSPPEVIVIGCEPASIDPGIGLTPEVEAAVEAAERLVWHFVDAEIGKGDACVPCDSGSARRVLG
ncbi:MAG: peptidase M52, partial [Acidobacteriota bacterium]